MKQNKCNKKTSGYDVIIAGSYGFENIGDDAMLLAIIKNLQAYKKDIRIAVITRNPEKTGKLLGVDTISRANLFLIIYAMKKAKLFMYGGGNIIQDTTSSRSLFYYLSLIWIAKQMHIKIMLYANGIGPINKSINRQLTHMVLNKVDVITLREYLSLMELKILNVEKPAVFMTADPALTLNISNIEIIEGILSSEGIDSKGPFVGFSVRKYPGHEKLQHEKYEDDIAHIADFLIEKHKVTPVFIPMHYSVDIPVINNIISKMNGKGYVIKNKYNVPDTLGIISKMDMLVGMRLHALIMAASQGIPVVGLVYDPKIEGFLQYIGQPSAGHIHHLNLNELKNIIDNIWNNRVSIKQQLEIKITKLKSKAMEDAKIAVNLIDNKLIRDEG